MLAKALCFYGCTNKSATVLKTLGPEVITVTGDYCNIQSILDIIILDIRVVFPELHR